MKPSLLNPAENTLGDFPPLKRFLIGVSGGRDSVALLHQLHALGYSKLIVCHLDHQLRGRSAQADARFVSRLAASLALPCQIGRTDVRALARQSKVSIETAARIARYAFFVSVARRARCCTIFLGHHADDLVETVLLNFFRGASPGGMAALRRSSQHRVGRTEITVLRPLLHVWRREIDAYIALHHLKYREDSSNALRHATRNRIRHRIIPYIEKQFGRDVRKAVWRAAQIWSEEELLLETLTDANSFSGAEIDVRSLRQMPVALQRRVLLLWLRAQDVDDIRFDVVEKVRALIEPGSEKAKVNLPRSRYARRRAGKLFLTPH